MDVQIHSLQHSSIHEAPCQINSKSNHTIGNDMSIALRSIGQRHACTIIIIVKASSHTRSNAKCVVIHIFNTQHIYIRIFCSICLAASLARLHPREAGRKKDAKKPQRQRRSFTASQNLWALGNQVIDNRNGQWNHGGTRDALTMAQHTISF